MSGWEYKVVPAPTKGVKAKGIKAADARFAHALELLMNDMAADGWHFQRAETLPSTERAGLTGSTTEWRNLLVFRRAVAATASSPMPELLPAPAPVLEDDIKNVVEPVATKGKSGPDSDARDGSPDTDANAAVSDLSQMTKAPDTTPAGHAEKARENLPG